MFIAVFDRKILWGSKIQQAPPTVAYEDVIAENGRGLYKWLENVVCCFSLFLVGRKIINFLTTLLSMNLDFLL